MGYMRHHAIVVTAWASGPKDECPGLDKAREYAASLGMSVSPVTNLVTNGYRSFFVAPDGSKEGWAESVKGDTDRDRLVEYLTAVAGKDGFWPNWVEVAFPGDDYNAEVTRGSHTRERC